MSNNAQKTPFARSMGIFGQRKALEEVRKLGRAAPGHVVSVNGPIVTVQFDVAEITLPGPIPMPVFGSKRIRDSIQIGELGVAIPADYYLGGVSGLGGGTADNTLQGNLSALIWFPVGNKNWDAVPAGVVFDTSVVTATGNLSVGNGATGVFTDLMGQTVTVQNGIITNIE